MRTHEITDMDSSWIWLADDTGMVCLFFSPYTNFWTVTYYEEKERFNPSAEFCYWEMLRSIRRHDDEAAYYWTRRLMAYLRAERCPEEKE